MKSLLESAACLLEVVSHSVNGFFCLMFQKNTWNKVAWLGQHLSAQLTPWSVHPLLLSSSNCLFHEPFHLTRYDEKISYKENGILPSLPVEEEKWMLFGHWLHFNVCKPHQVWGLSFVLCASLLPKPFSVQNSAILILAKNQGDEPYL